MTGSFELKALLDEFDELTSKLADDASLLQLAACLDGLSRLACSVFRVEPSADETEPPSHGPIFHQGIAANFPMLGMYASQSSLKLDEAEIWTGDAVDDLADIASELADVRWHLEQGSTVDALWRFRFGYRSHWGQHYVDLRRVLHDQLFGDYGNWPD